MDDDDFEANGPVRGESLFAGDEDGFETSACLNFSPDMWESYASGYQVAARYLVDRVTPSSLDQDYLVYPIVFCYRHAAELRMKQAILSAGPRLERPSDFEETHDLRQLWSVLEALIREVWPNSPDDSVLIAVREQLDELARWDSGSFCFRYPVGRKGKDGKRPPSIPPKVKVVGLGTFATRMDRILHYLDGVDTGFSVEADQRAEQREFRSQMQAEMLADMDTTCGH